MTLCEKELVENLYIDSKIEDLLRENQRIIDKKIELKKNINSLKDCLKAMNIFEQSH